MGCGSNKEIIRTPVTVSINPLQFIGGIKTNFSKNYKVIKQLGGGNFIANIGEKEKSYVCAQRDTGITRVVNVRKRELGKEAETELFTELDILSQIDHPNIIKLLEVYEDGKNYYVVTEALTGGDLFEYITQRAEFTEHHASIIMKQILGALTYCHAKNIIHRNIKPQNIMFESKGSDSIVKIVDFAYSEIVTGRKYSSSIGSLYYAAPEVINSSYNEKCDIWSCGVLLYLLLCGYLPFIGETRGKTIEKISNGQYTMKGKQWDNVSEEAKDLVKHMLEYKPFERYSAEQAYAHEWIKKFNNESVSPELAREALTDLKKFSSKSKLQQATLTYIVTLLTTKSETKNLKEVFMSLDKNGKGELTKEDLKKGYKEIYGTAYSDEEIDEIMKNIDADKNGLINYTEFAVATINKKEILSKERLEAAFKMFDKDGSGQISMSELKNVLVGNDQVSNDKWMEIIKQADTSEDNEISMDEFVALMQKLINE